MRRSTFIKKKKNFSTGITARDRFLRKINSQTKINLISRDYPKSISGIIKSFSPYLLTLKLIDGKEVCFSFFYYLTFNGKILTWCIEKSEMPPSIIIEIINS
jgi:hypothetical protein